MIKIVFESQKKWYNIFKMGKMTDKLCQGNNSKYEVMFYEVTDGKEKEKFNFNYCCYYRYMFYISINHTLYL